MNRFMIMAIIALVAISIITGGYLYMVEQNNTIERKFPHWGWDNHAGLRCRNPDNTGCNTMYDKNGKLVEVQ